MDECEPICNGPTRHTSLDAWKAPFLSSATAQNGPLTDQDLQDQVECDRQRRPASGETPHLRLDRRDPRLAYAPPKYP